MPRRLPEAPEGGVQAALCGKHRQGRWFESTIRSALGDGFKNRFGLISFGIVLRQLAWTVEDGQGLIGITVYPDFGFDVMHAVSILWYLQFESLE